MKTLALTDDYSNLDEFEAAMQPKLKVLWSKFQDKGQTGFTYSDIEKWQSIFKLHGLSFNYGLDAEPYEFLMLV